MTIYLIVHALCIAMVYIGFHRVRLFSRSPLPERVAMHVVTCLVAPVLLTYWVGKRMRKALAVGFIFIGLLALQSCYTQGYGCHGNSRTLTGSDVRKHGTRF